MEIPKIFRKQNTVKDRQISVEHIFQLKRCQVSDLVSQQRSLQIDPGLFDRHSLRTPGILSQQTGACIGYVPSSKST